MEKWPKDKLITEISKVKEETKFYQTKLRDVVTAYKSLLKEKEALESGFEAFKNVSQSATTDKNETQSENKDEASAEVSEGQQKTNSQQQLTTLMNSLSTLSAEKSRMEATFQADKKSLRQEKEKYEVMVRELQDKLKTMTFDLNKDIEHYKSSLIIEKHEREKERNDNKMIIKELQDLLSHEKNEKIYLEQTLSELASREEVERFKEIDITEKFVNLQKKHMITLEQERKKVQQMENESKDIERAYEQRVAGLENRLAELSSTLVRYNRNRQEDQNEILKLKAKIAELSAAVPNVCVTVVDSTTQTNHFDILKDKNDADVSTHVRAIKDKLLYYENLLLNANDYCEKSLKTDSAPNHKYETNMISPNEAPQVVEKMDTLRIQENKNENDNLKIKISMLTEQNSLLNDHLTESIKRHEKQQEKLREQQNVLCHKYEEEITSLHRSYKSQILDLEVQVQKQRDRTLALLEEKEQEVTTLKTSFQMFVPGNKHSFTLADNSDDCSAVVSHLDGLLSGTSNQMSQENPHILHYSHELARRDVVISGLRKNCCQLENSLRDIRKEIIMLKQSNTEQVATLNSQINRLERCQSREGANLEYLKNVIVNYLHSKNTGSKRHMLNAIAAVLKLTDSEMTKIKKAI